VPLCVSVYEFAARVSVAVGELWMADLAKMVQWLVMWSVGYFRENGAIVGLPLWEKIGE
jgi:hypothetical protein